MSTSFWDYHSPVRIRFGRGRIDEIATLVHGTVLVVTTTGSGDRGFTERVVTKLDRPVVYEGVRSHPTVEDVEAAISQLRGQGIGTIVGLGGGSAIDIAKILSLALATPSLELSHWIDADPSWVSAPQPLPLVAIPTTAGTGSEVTPFATLWHSGSKKKLSVGTSSLHPAVAIVDPELTLSMPWKVTLSTGLDAYSQCFEAICNRNATPLTTAVAERGLSLAPKALRVLLADPGSLDARTIMAEAALLSGMAIGNTRTGLAHSISYPLTSHLGIPHGLACALALPAVLAFNAETDDGPLARIADQAGLPGAKALAPALLGLYDELGVRAVVRSHIPDLAAIRKLGPEMMTPGRADNNIRPIQASDLDRILAVTEAWLGSEEAGS